MSRKLTHSHAMKASGSASLNLGADVTTDVTNVKNSDNIGIQIVWTGSSPLGDLSIQTSNDYDPVLNVGTWTALDFGSTITITGNSGNHIISINQVPFTSLRLFYDRTSGTGTMTANLVMKTVGA